MIRTIVPLTTLLLAACSLVHPVKGMPRSAPKAYTVDLDAARSKAPGETPSSKPVERVTRREVWWSVFADPVLDGVIQEALRNNYFIKDVRTLIYEGRFDPNAPQGWLWPLQVGVSPLIPANVQHLVLRGPPDTSSAAAAARGPAKSEYNAANIDLTASYQVDLWGNIDAQSKVADNLSEQQRQNTENASQNLAVQVAGLWFDILVERALKELTEREVKYNQDLFNLVKARFDQHLTPRLAVLQQEQRLLSVQSQVPLITAQIAMLNSQLTGLLGRLPSPSDQLVPADRRLPDLPPAPALGTPDDLFENTGEMRFAKLRVTEIEHRVNQNLSSWLPTIELIGSVGAVSFDFDKPVGEGFAGVRLAWPLFDGGRRIAEAKLLDLTLKRRKWQYELAIKSAVGRVQDAVLQEKSQAESLRSLRGQIDLGRRLLDEARRLFEQGQSDYLPVLNALASLAALERDGLRAQRLLLNYRVQLYRALGATWSYDVTIVPD